MIRTRARALTRLRRTTVFSAVRVAAWLLLPGALVPVASAQGQERIVVSGASGNLGGLVVDELLARGVDPGSLILVSRTPAELSRYAEMGADTRFGDFTQPESLSAAYAGGTRLLLISINPIPDRPQAHRNAIDAAVQAGVRHIVYTSSVDAENADRSRSAAEHLLTEQYIRESGAAWTMLRNHLYMNSLVNDAARMVSQGSVTVQPDEVPAAYVTREDCAAAAAAVLAGSGHENRIYDITGPELVLRRDVARMASEVTGIPIELVIGEGGESQVAGVMAGFAAFGTLTTAVEDLTGRPSTSVGQLMEANREALLAARP